MNTIEINRHTNVKKIPSVTIANVWYNALKITVFLSSTVYFISLLKFFAFSE